MIVWEAPNSKPEGNINEYFGAWSKVITFPNLAKGKKLKHASLSY